MPIPISVASAIETTRAAQAERPQFVKTEKSTSNFAEQVKDFVGQVDEAQKTADAKMEAVAEGRDNDLHGTMIAMEEAGIQLRLMATVRNKVVEAYREVMRMGA